MSQQCCCHGAKVDLRGFRCAKMKTRESSFFHEFFCVDAWLYVAPGDDEHKNFSYFSNFPEFVFLLFIISPVAICVCCLCLHFYFREMNSNDGWGKTLFKKRIIESFRAYKNKYANVNANERIRGIPNELFKAEWKVRKWDGEGKYSDIKIMMSNGGGGEEDEKSFFCSERI